MDYSDSVMIALLPVSANWCRIAVPHMTLVYAGKIPDLSPTAYNEMGKQVLELSRACGPIVLKVSGPDIFGDGVEDDPMVDVLILEETADLRLLRARVEKWNASEHEFNPHITVGPVGSLSGDIPNQIVFDRISLSWGAQGFSTRLSQSMDRDRAEKSSY